MSEIYSQFYIECFYREAVDNGDALMSGMEETQENKQVIADTKVFERLFVKGNAGFKEKLTKKSQEAEKEDRQTDDHTKGIKKILARNLDLLHQKIDDMDQIGGIVDIQPLKRTFMPQMANKKRYNQVQRVVSPNKLKGQKPVSLFKEDNFIRDTLKEINYYEKDSSGMPIEKKKTPVRPSTSTATRKIQNKA